MMMERPTIIFDYDQTLSPGESVADVIGLAIADRRDGDLARRVAGFQGPWPRVPRRLSDAVATLGIVRSVHRRHIEAYVQTRRRPPDDLASLFRALRAREIRLHIVSSAYRDWLLPIGLAWGFAESEIHARYRLGWLGDMAHSLNASHFLPQPSKAEIIKELIRNGAAGHPMLIVGDGEDDFEAFCNVPADSFLEAGYYRDRPVAASRERQDGSGFIARREALPEAILSAMAGLMRASDRFVRNTMEAAI